VTGQNAMRAAPDTSPVNAATREAESPWSREGG
jgi:hypothetical protein